MANDNHKYDLGLDGNGTQIRHDNKLFDNVVEYTGENKTFLF